MSKCIVSFASTGRENYNSALLRLIRSVKDSGWDGELFVRSYDGYVDEYLGVKIELGEYPKTEKYGQCYNNFEVPYAFKPFIAQEAIEKGAEVVVWADSTIVFLKDIQPLLDYAKEYGICAFNNLGYPLQDWISDLCLERSGISEEELPEVKQCMGCFLIFDLTNETGKRVFDRWIELSRDGVSFQNYGSEREGFRMHRHDQSVLSTLIHLEKIPMREYGDGFCYHPHELGIEFTDGKEVYVINKGL